MQLLRRGLAYRLHLIAFITGVVLMVYELIAARLLAPTIGSSTYVWTSVIGVIIAALSLGYWAGGVVADARQRRSDLIWLLLIVAATMTLTIYMHQALLANLLASGWDVRWQAVMASLLLFAPSSFGLGMISPYLVKLEVRSLQVAGRTVASLSALNSIGGISGTFLAGFFLFGWIGARETLAALVGLTMLSSWSLRPNYAWRLRLSLSIVIGLAAISGAAQPRADVIDTAAARYTIAQWQGQQTTLRGLLAGPAGVQSGVDVNDPGRLVFWYTAELAKLVDAANNKQNILILGGGTLTLPQFLADKYPASRIDVVEIDRELFELARQHFFYTDPKNIELIASDARRYVQSTERQYDIILVDVYQDGQMPFTTVTTEFASALKARLRPNGLVGLNIIAGQNGACRDLLAAVNGSFSARFGPGRFNFEQNQGRTNLIAAYGQLGDQSTRQYQSEKLEPGVNLSDNFAPTDRLTEACQSQ